MQKAAIAMLLGMLMWAGCAKHSDAEKAAERARGHALPDLVFAANAPLFDAGGIPYVEAVWIDGIWKIHDGGVWRADCRSVEEIHMAMQDIWEKRSDSRILISAGGGTAFREIANVVRNSARAGFRRLDFLVATGVPSHANHSLRLRLAKAEEMPLQPDIDPLFIVLDARGAVYYGTGPDQVMLDADPADHAMPNLNKMLEMFTAAARAADAPLFLQVHADPAVNYQRVIDVLARFYEHRIMDINFTNLDLSMYENATKRQDTPKAKPSSPSSRSPIPMLPPSPDE